MTHTADDRPPRAWVPTALFAATLAATLAAAQSPPASSLVQAPGKAMSATADDASLQWARCPEFFPAGCELAVIRGEPAKGQSDAFLRVPGGYNFPAHTHTSPEHIVMVSGEMIVRYQGQAPITVRAGHFLYNPGGVPHDAQCRGTTRCILFISFDQPIDAMPFSGTL